MVGSGSWLGARREQRVGQAHGTSTATHRTRNQGSDLVVTHSVACVAQAFVHSNHVPLLFRLPGPARPQRLTAFAENVDIMPTIADLAGITVPPLCATEAESLATALCTEGRSLAPLIDAPAAPTAGVRSAQQVTLAPKLSLIGHLRRDDCSKRRSTSRQPYQYGQVANEPRLKWQAAEKGAAFWQWTKQMIEDLPVMGYAMATDDSGSTYRYTEVCTHDRLGLPHPSCMLYARVACRVNSSLLRVFGKQARDCCADCMCGPRGCSGSTMTSRPRATGGRAARHAWTGPRTTAQSSVSPAQTTS